MPKITIKTFLIGVAALILIIAWGLLMEYLRFSIYINYFN